MPRYTIELLKGTYVIDDAALNILIEAANNHEALVKVQLDLFGDDQFFCEGVINPTHIISIIPIAESRTSSSGQQTDESSRAEARILAFPSLRP